MHARVTLALFIAVAGLSLDLPAQATTNPPATANRRRGAAPIDPARASQLYVSNRFEDLPKSSEYDAQIRQKRSTDSTYAARSAGVMEFRKVTYKSRPDGRDVPAYLF